MSNLTDAPAEQLEQEVNNSTTETVRDAEAVLRKNRELLDENAKYKQRLSQLGDFDFEKAREAMTRLQQIEEEQMQKRGEYEKLLERTKQNFEEKVESERQQRARLEAKLKEEKLGMALVENGVLPDRVGYLVKELSEQVELELGENGIALKRRGGIGDASEFNALVEDVRAKSPFFFAANIVSGTGGSGSNGSGLVSSRSWADLNGAEKAVAIREAGGDIELAKKKFK